MKKKLKKLIQDLFYDWVCYDGFGSGGYYKFNTQRLINVILFGLIITLFIIVL